MKMNNFNDMMKKAQEMQKKSARNASEPFKFRSGGNFWGRDG